MGRDGRGRLSSIDLLPEEAREDEIWAKAELNARKRHAVEIFNEFNQRLEAKGLESVSRSAFYRMSKALSAAADRIQMARDMFAGIAEELKPDDVDTNNIALGEFIKTLIAEILSQSEGDLEPKQAMELAKAFQSVVSAQKTSSDRRSRLERDIADRTTKAADAVGAVAREAGLSDEAVSSLRKKFFEMAG